MMDRSCRICGLFIENVTADNIGYCLYYDEKDTKSLWRRICARIGISDKFTGESLKISDGEERSIALNCKVYFRKVPDISPIEFLNWRVGIQIFNIQKKLLLVANFIALAILVATCFLVYDSFK